MSNERNEDMSTLIFTFIEVLVMCLIYTAYLAMKIRKNAVPLVFLYPQEIQDISIKHGDITLEHIKRIVRNLLFLATLYLFPLW